VALPGRAKAARCAFPSTLTENLADLGLAFASENGPSSTVTVPARSMTRPPFAVAAKPPCSMSTPAFEASMPRFMIASISAFGGGPLPSTDLTIVMNRIVSSVL
jgi:hypothetical protein